MTYILLIFVYSINAGAMNSITGFVNLEDCKQAGERAIQLSIGTGREIRYDCITQISPPPLVIRK